MLLTDQRWHSHQNINSTGWLHLLKWEYFWTVSDKCLTLIWSLNQLYWGPFWLLFFAYIPFSSIKRLYFNVKSHYCLGGKWTPRLMTWAKWSWDLAKRHLSQMSHHRMDDPQPKLRPSLTAAQLPSDGVWGKRIKHAQRLRLQCHKIAHLGFAKGAPSMGYWSLHESLLWKRWIFAWQGGKNIWVGMGTFGTC